MGRTGLSVSVWAFGGIVVKDTTAIEARDYVARAVEHGVNYFDVAPSYGDAQNMLGPAIRPHRQDIYLACKTARRDAEGARIELEESLRLLKTDYFDVYQLHGLSDMEETEAVIAPGGALETLIQAREQDKIRNIGFSSHGDAYALRLMQAFDFDTVLFPVNWASYLKNGMAAETLKLAESRNMGRLAIKALAHCPKVQGDVGDDYRNCWYRPIYDDDGLAEMALRFTLSRPVHAAISPGDMRMFDLGLRILEKTGGAPAPLSDEQIGELTARARALPKALFE